MNRYFAFLYQDYYCYGIGVSSVGNYNSVEDILEYICGKKGELENLEILDTVTGGFSRYRWKPKYIVEGNKLVPAYGVRDTIELEDHETAKNDFRSKEGHWAVQF